MWIKLKDTLKKNRTNVLVCAGLFLASQLFCVLFVWRYGLFGSDIDWISQHSVLPDYFRQRFYDTGSLFPDFAWNLGAGQNIYNLSYYGLFSPVILFSYLLPFVKMDQYIMISSMVAYGMSGVLLYVWVAGARKRQHKGGVAIPLGAALLFVLASPMLYHSYNQLMFVNYMPFLVLALIGAERYMHEGKRGLLLVGTFCMILTSYFFSVGGLLALGLYMLGKRMEFRKRVAYVGNLLLGVALAGFHLVPTALSLFAGRVQSPQAGNDAALQAVQTSGIENWFVPVRFLYSPYGLGLTAIVFFVIAGMLLHARTWERRVQVWGLLLVLVLPIVAKLLNGGLYVKNKVFLPFLPLLCMEAALEMQRLKAIGRGKLKNKKVFAGILLQCAIVLGLIAYTAGQDNFEDYRWLLWADAALLIVGVWCYIWFPKLPYPLFCACGILLCYHNILHPLSHHMIEREAYRALGIEECRDKVGDILQEDKDFYRTEVLRDGAKNLANINRVLDIRQNLSSIYSSGYDGGYHRFRNEVFNLNMPFRNIMMQSVTDNPCFLQFMGVRYVLSPQRIAGYEKKEAAGQGMFVYANKGASPICYATDRVLGQQEYEELAFPDNQTCLMQYAVVGGEKNGTNVRRKMEPCDIALLQAEGDELEIKADGDGYEVTAKKEVTLDVPISAASGDNLLAVQMDIENLKNKDMHVRINGQTNRLTKHSHEYANHNNVFHFVVTIREEGHVQMKLSKGHYRISGLRAWSGKMEDLADEGLYEAPLQCADDQPSGDSLRGTIEVDRPSYLITTIPYDSRFKVEIDGKEVETQAVNTSFLGAEVSEGKHEIAITYRAPGKLCGMLMSACALAAAALLSVAAKRRQKTKMAG